MMIFISEVVDACSTSTGFRRRAFELACLGDEPIATIAKDLGSAIRRLRLRPPAGHAQR